jgi:hypothetical protein
MANRYDYNAVDDRRKRKPVHALPGILLGLTVLAVRR